MSEKFVVVLTTTGSLSEARRISRLILQKKMAGCVNIVRGIDSWYWWKDNVEHSREILLLIKTSHSLLSDLSRLLKTHHSYDVPELIALPIQWGAKSYLDWLGESIGTSQSHRGKTISTNGTGRELV